MCWKPVCKTQNLSQAMILLRLIGHEGSSALCPKGKIAVGILLTDLWKSKSWSGKISLDSAAGEESLWNTKLSSACCRAVPKEVGSTGIN